MWWLAPGREGGAATLSLIPGRCSEAWHPVLSVVPLLPTPTLCISHEAYSLQLSRGVGLCCDE